MKIIRDKISCPKLKKEREFKYEMFFYNLLVWQIQVALNFILHSRIAIKLNDDDVQFTISTLEEKNNLNTKKISIIILIILQSKKKRERENLNIRKLL